MADDAGHTFEAITSLRASNRALLEDLADLDETDLPAAFLERIDAFREQARQAGAYLSAPNERAEAQSILNFWLTVRYVSGQQAASILLDEFDLAGAQERAAGASPYKGLEAFQVRDRDRFFGRQSVVSDILDKLAHARLIAVTGLSGSGKSSIVRAGLIPALMDGAMEGSQGWRFLDPIVPGSDPLAALDALLAQAGLAGAPLAAPAQLTEALDRAGAPVVLSIDQFEETFTIAGPGPRRALFLDAVMHAAANGEHRHIVVITMRSEFSVYVEQHAALDAAFKAGGVLVGAILGPGLRLAIEQPAGQLGVRFEAGLVEELLHSVLGEPAGLPLLQFTLLELWNSRDGDLITTALYKDLGGSPRDILARRAAEVFDGFALESDRILTRRIFGRLVQIGSGLDATSRRVCRRDLDEVGPTQNIDYVLERWRKSGLIRISPPGPIAPASLVEVAHEALIRNWRQLVEWIELDFAKSRQRVLLMERAVGWKNGAEGLLPELSLKEAEGYQGLEPLEADYVKASRRAVDEAYNRRRWIWRGTIAAGLVGALLLAYGAFTTYQSFKLQRESARLTQQAKRLTARAAAASEQGAANLKLARAALSDAEAFKAQAEQARGDLAEIEARTRDGRKRLADLTSSQAKLTAQRDEGTRQLAAIGAQKVALESEVKDARTALASLRTSLAEQTQLASANGEALNAEVQQRVLSDRPALSIRGGRLERPPPVWAALEKTQEPIIRAARSVGRVGGAKGWTATGFAVGDEMVVTFLPEKDALPAFIDFTDGVPGDARFRFRIQRSLAVIPLQLGGFLAILETESHNEAGEPLPAPLPIEFIDEKSARLGLPLVIVGTPDPRGTETQDLEGQILRLADGFKRAAPGFLTRATPTASGLTLAYDNTSYPGSAGAPIINLDTGRVIGVHFATDSRSGKDRSQMRNYGIAFDRQRIPPAVLREIARGRDD